MKYKMQRNTRKGKLLVFTGVDGSGKTTLLNISKQFLNKQGIDFIVTKMPSDRIRQIDVFRNFHDSNDEKVRNKVGVFGLTVLASGDRLIVQDTDIIPNLEKGIWVLCDRYCYTGNVRCDDPIITAITEMFIMPDMAFLATASAPILKQRVLDREDEKELYYDDDGVDAQVVKYNQIAKDNDFFVINTEQDYRTMEDEIKSLILSLITIC